MREASRRCARFQAEADDSRSSLDRQQTGFSAEVEARALSSAAGNLGELFGSGAPGAGDNTEPVAGIRC